MKETGDSTKNKVVGVLKKLPLLLSQLIASIEKKVVYSAEQLQEKITGEQTVAVDQTTAAGIRTTHQRTVFKLLLLGVSLFSTIILLGFWWTGSFVANQSREVAKDVSGKISNGVGSIPWQIPSGWIFWVIIAIVLFLWWRFRHRTRYWLQYKTKGVRWLLMVLILVALGGEYFGWWNYGTGLGKGLGFNPDSFAYHSEGGNTRWKADAYCFVNGRFCQLAHHDSGWPLTENGKQRHVTYGVGQFNYSKGGSLLIHIPIANARNNRDESFWMNATCDTSGACASNTFAPIYVDVPKAQFTLKWKVPGRLAEGKLVYVNEQGVADDQVDFVFTLVEHTEERFSKLFWVLVILEIFFIFSVL